MAAQAIWKAFAMTQIRIRKERGMWIARWDEPVDVGAIALAVTGWSTNGVAMIMDTLAELSRKGHLRKLTSRKEDG